MHSKFKKFLALPAALLLSVGIWGCENQSDPISPLLQSGDEGTVVMDVIGQSYTVVREGSSAYEKATFVIGPDDNGELVIGRHTLTVPEGAVSVPTTFTMVKPWGRDLEFSLTATATGANGETIDVGGNGFLKPVTLTANYTGSTIPMNEESLVVAWLRPDGIIEVQETVVNTSEKTVSSELSHFSAYVIATPN